MDIKNISKEDLEVAILEIMNDDEFKSVLQENFIKAMHLEDVFDNLMDTIAEKTAEAMKNQ